MANEIEIPDGVRVPKPNYPVRPGPELVREIKAHIRETARPYLWHGQTYDKPPPGCTVIYLGEFDVPQIHKGWRAPCPCCSPTSPKYNRNGKIAYFPDEMVIRIIGPDCYRTLDPEGHEHALAVLRAEQRREEDIAHLLRVYPAVPGILRTLGGMMETVRALDDLRAKLPKTLDRLLGTKLWPHVRTGMLVVRVQQEEVYVDRNHEHQTHTVDVDVNYGVINGLSLLKPKPHALAPRIDGVLAELRSLFIGENLAERIQAMTDNDRREKADIIRRALPKARLAIEEALDIQSFFSTVNIATLRNWGRAEGCPIGIFMARDRPLLLVGRSEGTKTKLIIPEAALARIETLPELSDLIAAE